MSTLEFSDVQAACITCAEEHPDEIYDQIHPSKVKGEEVCVYCGSQNRSGIYVIAEKPVYKTKLKATDTHS